jgi:hypothetical protein
MRSKLPKDKSIHLRRRASEAWRVHRVPHHGSQLTPKSPTTCSNGQFVMLPRQIPMVTSLKSLEHCRHKSIDALPPTLCPGLPTCLLGHAPILGQGCAGPNPLVEPRSFGMQHYLGCSPRARSPGHHLRESSVVCSPHSRRPILIESLVERLFLLHRSVSSRDG